MERKGDETNDGVLIIVLNTHAPKPSHNTSYPELLAGAAILAH